MQRLILAALRAYQRHLSQWTPACPMELSCSAYAVSAVERHGWRVGLRAARRRLETCGR